MILSQNSLLPAAQQRHLGQSQNSLQARKFAPDYSQFD